MLKRNVSRSTNSLYRQRQASVKVASSSNKSPFQQYVGKTLTEEDVKKYSPEELYELAFRGSASYWDSPVFSILNQEEEDFISNLVREIDVVESIYTCPSCSYNRILVRQEQKGGGDESLTTMFRCTKCGYSWSNSGRG